MTLDFRTKLLDAQARNRSLLCVGLDPEPARFPGLWTGRHSRIFDFCAEIVDSTHDLACAFKPQIAHFAAHGAEDQLERLIAHIRTTAPDVPIILDAKRGDIGSTAEQYAKEAFERYGADATTVSPYLGFDSIEPYLAYEDRGTFVLCRTSNPGGGDLQGLRLENGDLLYEHVARVATSTWNTNGQVGLVTGATWPTELERVRHLAPTAPLLVPGVGAQGGDIEAIVRAGLRLDAAGATTGPIVVSSSRAVLYASSGANFGDAARAEARRTCDLLAAAASRAR